MDTVPEPAEIPSLDRWSPEAENELAFHILSAEDGHMLTTGRYSSKKDSPQLNDMQILTRGIKIEAILDKIYSIAIDHRNLVVKNEKKNSISLPHEIELDSFGDIAPGFTVKILGEYDQEIGEVYATSYIDQNKMIELKSEFMIIYAKVSPIIKA